jgi:hypothetical protein
MEFIELKWLRIMPSVRAVVLGVLNLPVSLPNVAG